MENKKCIYELKLHETTKLSNGVVHVTRVPGGWIYKKYLRDDYYPLFVPFNNEFDPHKNGDHNGV